VIRDIIDLVKLVLAYLVHTYLLLLELLIFIDQVIIMIKFLVLMVLTDLHFLLNHNHDKEDLPRML